MWRIIRNYILDSLKKFLKWIRDNWYIALIVILLLYSVYYIFDVILHIDENSSKLAYSQIYISKKYSPKIQDIHYIYMTILTAMYVMLAAILALVAWIQLRNLNKTSSNDFLMRITEQYGNAEIVKARTIIHRFYQLTYSKDICKEVHHKRIAEMIEQSKFSADPEEFICLHNFVDLLERIAYFANKGIISDEQIRELFRGSFIWYSSVFNDFIHERRKKYKDNSYYCEIEKLVKKLEREKNNNLS